MKKQMYRIFVILFLVGLVFLPGSRNIVSGQSHQSDEDCLSCDHVTHDILPISQDDPRIVNLKKLQKISSVEQNYGDLVWGEATIQLMDDKQWQILAVPIKNESSTEIQILLAATQNASDFQVLVFGMTYTEVDSSELNATLKFYSPEGGLSALATYRDGELQKVERGEEEATTKGLNWACFVDCLGELGLEFLPTCSTFCAFCLGAPNPYNPGCWGCAACIGGAAFTCIIGCWE